MLSTSAGELNIFSSIEDALTEALPQEPCEWRRSLGRSVRFVNVGATFIPFSPAALPKNTQWDLIKQPIFHIYWTECNDVDVYKASVRDDIDVWLKELQAKDISDWLIVVVENFDGKRANKLIPRTTVFDKIRTDFASKQGDHCVSVINPSKPEARLAESWRGLVNRIRHLLLVGYGKAMLKLEDYVRQQRERRNEVNWNFMEYFNLQEELAQVLEMLGLHDESLVQYDELDALFSQFIVNSQVGDNTLWLNSFQKPLERWHGLKLKDFELHEDPSVLELRAYLFGKQSQMLLSLNKIWEVASRCLPFLHTCTRELSVLEISSPPGAVACWLFLACMEVLQCCNKFNQADQVEAFSLHTANLWAYASQKLRHLGMLCGLMPGSSPSSDQLHTVVYLSAGMGDNPGSTEEPSSTDKLKKSICSQTFFNKTYLELAELAVGTYKHIGRLRSARLIGIEVASFYMLLGEVQKSAAFLGDALRTFEEDNWKELAAQTQIELAECYKISGDTRKYIRTCSAVAAAPEVDNLIRWSYFDEMRRSHYLLDRVLIVPFKDVIKIVSATVKNQGIITQDTLIEVELVLDSNFPGEILCDVVKISIETDVKDAKKIGRRCSNILTAKDLKQDVLLQHLHIYRHLDHKQDKQLASASVVCRNVPLKRADSNASPFYRSEFNKYLSTVKTPFVLTPGVNVLKLNKTAIDIGKYYLGQVAIHSKLMEFISISMVPRLSFEVQRKEPTIRLDKGKDPLLCGIEQVMQLSVLLGSYSLEERAVIKLIGSRGISMKLTDDEPFTGQLEFTLEEIQPFSKVSMPLRIFADILSRDHQVTIGCPWAKKPESVSLNFLAPLTTSWRLHTVNHRKFVQIRVTGQCEKELLVRNFDLTFGSTVKVKGLTVSPSHVIPNGLNVSFTYELLINHQKNTPKLKGDFSLQYAMKEDAQPLNLEYRDYHYYFEIVDYETLYRVDAKLEPTKGNEFCRVGTLCHLQLVIKPVGHSLEDAAGSLMYEVVAEQSIWAVCGRTAGVISFESLINSQTVTLDVMPLSSGYLPFPLVRVSKYIPADYGVADNGVNKTEQHPRLEPFNPGQVYNASKGQQVYVINSSSELQVSLS